MQLFRAPKTALLTSLLASVVLVTVVAGCGNDLGVETPDSSNNVNALPSGNADDPLPSGGGNTDGDGSGTGSDGSDGSDNGDGSNGGGTNGDGSNGGGTNGDDEPINPPPSQQAQSCNVWQDCGPRGDDRNSGFDCDVGQCACNVAGTYDDECRRIGGTWSEEECFCFVTNSQPPADTSSQEDDDVYCWWDWHEECEPDEWVDRSYYRRECNGDDCYDRYVRDGYWRNGSCDDIWTRRCDDGTEVEYR